MNPWLLIVVAIVCGALGAAAGIVLTRSRESSAAPGALGGLDAGGAVPVLAALRSNVVVLDADDDVVRASAAAYTFNIVRDDAVCEPQVAQMVREVRETGEVEDREITVARGRLRGAGHFYLQVRVAGIGDGRILVLVEDRTAEKRLEDMRRDFVVNVSHELKTPVGAISLLAETVQDNADDPEVVTDFIGRIRKESARLGVLVQEIIELSRLQDGDALAEPEDVDIDAVVAESLDRVRVEAQAGGVELVSGGTRGLHVLGDSALVATAVRNLLDNAIRYSGPRTRVSVGVSADPDNPDLVRIAVVDQGIGISKEDQERIFERFYRVDKARSRATGGTGLGLSIVKHVASDHGGDVTVWSQPGRGSTFTLILPRMPEITPRTGAPTDPPLRKEVVAEATAAGGAFAALAAISPVGSPSTGHSAASPASTAATAVPHPQPTTGDHR